MIRYNGPYRTMQLGPMPAAYMNGLGQAPQPSTVQQAANAAPPLLDLKAMIFLGVGFAAGMVLSMALTTSKD
jgi:hypothetical protein